MQDAPVLILTSRSGGGHVSLAEALRDHIEPEFPVRIFDPEPRAGQTQYRFVTRHALWLWNAGYKLSNTPARARMAQRFYALTTYRRLRRVMIDTQPALVISTYALFGFVVQLAIRRARRRGRAIAGAVLFADPMNIHKAWLADPSVDMAFAPTQETYDEALAAGFSPNALKLIGWPVRRQFYEQRMADRGAFLRSLGLNPDRFTVFVQGGGEGAARFARTVESLLAINQERGARDARLQIILAVGTNELLKQRFSGSPNVYVLPFTRQIAPYMDAADLVMGKAGPNMLFESVTLGKPFVATTYIPGQEEPNLEFITRHGLGWVALEDEKQRGLVRTLLDDSGALAAMRASVERRRELNREQNATILPATRALIERVRSK